MAHSLLLYLILFFWRKKKGSNSSRLNSVYKIMCREFYKQKYYIFQYFKAFCTNKHFNLQQRIYYIILRYYEKYVVSLFNFASSYFIWICLNEIFIIINYDVKWKHIPTQLVMPIIFQFAATLVTFFQSTVILYLICHIRK